ncbi:alcohol dehydrogenase-like 6 isoform X5 [Cryptomeria japonica]|uniref:alcohol dehydrogenase-like 6 isoform X5 n=1 Tax=Cryptomeria japonica TaxID=3369 RepID=UPI0027DA0B4D|nr:alcohol dehydrogenase-like 6 isoform X5 [Cryptomeria japonica]
MIVLLSELGFARKGHVPIFPRIFGHEATRIIQSVGEGVIDRREDDCVLTFFTRECKECMHSKSDKRNMSETLRMVRKGVMHGDQKTHFSVNGKPISHFCAVSSFSEYAVVHSGYIVKLSSYVPFGKICVLGCGIATDNSPIGHDIQAVGRSPHKMIEAAMQSTAKGKIQTIRQAYLSKYSSNLRGDWKRRLFVLDSRGMLYYYRKQD